MLSFLMPNVQDLLNGVKLLKLILDTLRPASFTYMLSTLKGENVFLRSYGSLVLFIEQSNILFFIQSVIDESYTTIFIANCQHKGNKIRDLSRCGSLKLYCLCEMCSHLCTKAKYFLAQGARFR